MKELLATCDFPRVWVIDWARPAQFDSMAVHG
jgi:hypothetical protein